MAVPARHLSMVQRSTQYNTTQRDAKSAYLPWRVRRRRRHRSPRKRRAQSQASLVFSARPAFVFWFLRRMNEWEDGRRIVLPLRVTSWRLFWRARGAALPWSWANDDTRPRPGCESSGRGRRTDSYSQSGLHGVAVGLPLDGRGRTGSASCAGSLRSRRCRRRRRGRTKRCDDYCGRACRRRCGTLCGRT